MYTQSVDQISESFIKPSHFPKDAKQILHLAPGDLEFLSIHYIQKGLLFKKPVDQESPINVLVEMLKDSLSFTLSHFYPLAGRLATLKQEDPQSYVVFIDCTNSPGAKFVQSKVDLTISDIVGRTYVPSIVHSFFDHYKAINHDGHTMSLLTVQVTELIDGIFIGCSFNHSVVDGTSFWHFVNSLSEVFKAKTDNKFPEISREPVYERWFPDGYGPYVSLPFSHTDQFLSRYGQSSKLKERIFHFSVAALARIKAKANAKCKDKGITVSTFQALMALIWRCVTRARDLPQGHTTSCKFYVNNRSRLDPPLSQNYFGNCVERLATVSTTGELLANDFTWAASKLNKVVSGHNATAACNGVLSWLQNPCIYQFQQIIEPGEILIGSSPRFNMYGTEFGMGKAVAILSGHDNKSDGAVTLYPGHEGGGSIDTDLCLYPDTMSALECDEEFLDALNFSPHL